VRTSNLFGNCHCPPALAQTSKKRLLPEWINPWPLSTATAWTAAPQPARLSILQRASGVLGVCTKAIADRLYGAAGIATGWLGFMPSDP